MLFNTLSVLKLSVLKLSVLKAQSFNGASTAYLLFVLPVAVHQVGTPESNLLFNAYISIMISTDYAKLIRFLQEDLSIPQSSIAQALQQCKQDPGPLPMVLWQQGVLSLKQLEKIFDWMEMA